uniref:Preferentially expressed antigen in melanoma n=1 Tax=Capra hircus TaxID=9925 RepID=A0A452E258_CAPHI
DWSKCPQGTFQLNPIFFFRFFRICIQQVLKWIEHLAIAAPEELLIELFLPLFMMALAGRHTQALNVMVQAFPCLPLRDPEKDDQPHLETFQAPLDSLDVLLAQEVHSSIMVSVHLLLEPKPAQPMQKRHRSKTAQAPMQVLVDLLLKDDTVDQTLSHLRSLLHLHCLKLRIFTMTMQSIRRILMVVELDSVQDLEVNCTWKLAMLGRFMWHLEWIGNLCWLLLWHIHMLLHTALNQEEHCIARLTAQFLKLLHLQELYLDSISFLDGRLHQVLREAWHLTYLSQCPGVSLLKDLGLDGVNMTSLNLEPLQILIEKTLATLQDLDLSECGIMDSQLSVLLPSLSLCSQLTTFSLCGNPISMAVLKSLLHHTVGLSKISHVLYPSGWPSMVWFGTNPCPHCSDQIFYDTEPILCPCYIPA